MTEPPDLPNREEFWSRTALRRPSRVSYLWRCAQQQPPVAYFPPAKSLQQQIPPSTSHLFGSTRPKRRIQRRNIYGLQFYPSGTTAVFRNCLLSPPARGLSRQNPARRLSRQNQCKIDVRSRWFSRSSPRLPVFGIVARVASWEVHVRAG